MPQFMLNISLDAARTPWQAVDTTLIIPACMPEELHGLQTSGALAIGGYDSLLRSALKRGIFLTRKQLAQTCKELNVTLPGKNQGSGKNGRLVKQDFARSLVELQGCTSSSLDFGSGHRFGLYLT